jgi:hypothetical protein
MVYINSKQGLFDKPPTAFPLYVRMKSYVYTCGLADNVPIGKIGMNKKIRECLHVSLVDPVNVELYENPSDGFMTNVDMEIELGLVMEGQEVTELDDKAVADFIKKQHLYKYFKEGQVFVVPYQKLLLVFTTLSVKPEVHGDTNWRLGPDTIMAFRVKVGHKLKMKSQKQKTLALFQSNFKIEDMDIGGLDA